MHRTRALIVASVIAVAAPTTLAQPMQDTAPKATTVAPSPVRAISHYDLNEKKDNLAIDGYDPVAYFKEGGGKPAKGSKRIRTTYKEVTYHFANEENKARFEADPARYEPAYGGWCAWAMTSGEKTEINPKTFIVRDNRLYLFYNGFFGNTKKDWEKGEHDTLSQAADSQWKTISGESPRVRPTP
jgi:YHS domain-containing protein